MDILQAPKLVGKGVQKPLKGSLSNGKGKSTSKKDIPGKLVKSEAAKLIQQEKIPAGELQHSPLLYIPWRSKRMSFQAKASQDTF